MKISENKNYLETLKERAKTSHVYKKYQLIGLLIAQLLNDDKHKALYIKLAKNHNNDDLMRIAKDVSERKNIENKGAYFMKVLMTTHPNILSAKDKSASGKKNKI